MKNYKNNIILDYVQLGLRSFNLTNVIWLIYLYQKGFSPLDIGVFEALFHLSSMSLEVPSGMVADLIGRKKSRIIGVLLYLLYIVAIVYGTNFIVISIAFILCGASYAFESGSGEALIYDSLVQINETEKYIKITGNREIIFQMSSSIALVVGGYLATIDYKYNFVLVFIAFVTALIPILLMRETEVNKTKKVGNFIKLMYEHFILSTKTVLLNKNLRFLIIIGALLSAPVTTIFFYFQLYLSENFLMSELSIGSILAAHGFAGMLGGVFASKLEKKFKEKLLLYIVPLFLVLSFWLILHDTIIYIPINVHFVHLEAAFAISVPFLFLGFLDSILYIVLLDYINRHTPSDQRATILSFSSFAFSIVMIILFPTVGAIANFYGFRIAFMSLAIIISVLYFALIISLQSNNYTIKKVLK